MPRCHCTPTAFGRQQAAQRLLRDVDDVDGVTAGGEVVGKFAADQSRADDGDAFLAFNRSAEVGVVVEVVDGLDVGGAAARNRQADLVGAQRQHQFRIVQRFITDLQRMCRGVDGIDAGVGAYAALELFGHLRRRVQGYGGGCFFRGDGV